MSHSFRAVWSCKHGFLRPETIEQRKPRSNSVPHQSFVLPILLETRKNFRERKIRYVRPLDEIDTASPLNDDSPAANFWEIIDILLTSVTHRHRS